MKLSHDFVHLRVHSEYSVNEGAARLSGGGVVARAAELGMPALGLADINALFGAVKFYQSCRQHGIKPIIGCETALDGKDDSALLLLCADNEGYRTLCRLISRGYSENNGKVKRNWLEDDNRGLLVLSGGEHGEIGRALRNGDEAAALATATHWKECFGDRFYVETWCAASSDDGFVAASSIIAAKANSPLVATHPVQCARKEDKQMLEVRRCIAHNWLLSDKSRKRPFADPPHLLSVEEMQQRFADMPDALANSVQIAMRCNFSYSLGKHHLPKFDSDDETAAQIIVRLSRERLIARGLVGEQYDKRLNYELEIINQMGFADYYLIVADFVNWAKQQNIPVGPGRGSGVASLAAFALGITEIDPLTYGLLFERFLNPERKSLPDFDIDFCVDGRDKVINYVRTKYGTEKVAQIVTFGQIGARSSVRDVGRVLGYPYSLSDRLARLIPGVPDMTLEKAQAESPQLQQEIKDSEEVRDLLKLSLEVEGLPRNIGTHAGGVLIAPSPIVDFCPLYAAADTSSMVSQMDMTDIEQIGLVKFDFLGLKTLTIIAAAEKMLRDIGAVDENFSIANIPLDDAKVYKLYACADTLGIFQCESDGMRRVMKQIKPDCFGDVVAIIALFRPGPMQFIDQFTARKNGQEAVEYDHPELESLLRETYGFWLYQEQVMETARIISGYSLGEADLLRRAMGKKKPEEMEKQRQRFIEGAKPKMQKAAAVVLFNKLADFADYGFNKAHAVAYALISYWTGYLKAHYPATLYAAVMSVDAGDVDRMKKLSDNAHDAGITLQPPDINTGLRDFHITDKNTIIYGLQAIKSIGGALVDDIVTARGQQPFANLFDFCRRLSHCRYLTQAAVEHLIFAGAFDSIHPNRAAVRESLAVALEESTAQGTSLFGEATGVLTDAKPWDKRQTMLNEQKSIGFALNGSFYDLYQAFLNDAKLHPTKLANINGESSSLRIAGIYIKTKTPRVLRQRGMELIIIEDSGTGETEVMVGGDKLKALGKLNERQSLLIIEGRVDNNRNGQRVRGERLYTMESFLAKRACKLILPCNDSMSVKELQETLAPAKDKTGRCEVMIVYTDDVLQCSITLGNQWRLGSLLYERLQKYTVEPPIVEYRNVDV
ncbi:MAG: DNA polymerase III subunit alpha [Gammaproteobacteria bacterium WSBS_2016_MAG_OTU1]